MMVQRLPATQTLIDYLSRVPYGDLVSFSQIAKDCEISLKSHKHLLYSALKTLATEGVYFRSIRGSGYQRLHPDSGVDIVRKWHNGQQSRSTLKMSKQLNGANVGHLSPAGRKSLEDGLNEVWVRKQIETKLLKEEKRKAQRQRISESQQSLQMRLDEQHQRFLQSINQKSS